MKPQFNASPSLRLAALATVAAAALATGFAAPAALADTAAPVVAKTIRLNPNSAPVELKVKANKDHYDVNETISLNVKLSADAYLYVYSRDDNGNSTLIYPNADGRVADKPTAKGEHKLRNLLSGDKAGTETIVVFAAAKPVDFSDVDLSQVRTSELEGFLAAQGVGVKSDPQAGFSSLQPLTLNIGDAREARDARSAAGVAVVTTDKETYHVDEKVSLTFGASQPGYVHLYTVYADGRAELLRNEKFTVAGLKTIVATADAPTGEQAVVAIYTKGETLDKKKVGGLLSGGASAPALEKALRLNDDAQDAPLSVTYRAIVITNR